MTLRLPVFYGSYRRDRLGIRLADYTVRQMRARGHDSTLIDARAVGLPMLDRMYKEHAPGEAPPAMEALAERLRTADGFLFVVGEYNWGVQPGLKNLTDHFLEEWFWRPAGVLSYSAGRLGGARANLAWRGILNEMGMVTSPSAVTVGGIAGALDADGQPQGEGGAALEKSFPRFAAEFEWWCRAAAAARKSDSVPY